MLARAGHLLGARASSAWRPNDEGKDGGWALAGFFQRARSPRHLFGLARESRRVTVRCDPCPAQAGERDHYPRLLHEQRRRLLIRERDPAQKRLAPVGSEGPSP